MKYKDTTEAIPLPMQVWLVDSEYTGDSNDVSVTSLIKPLKKIIMGYRVPKNEDDFIEVSQLFKAQLGTAIHKALELIWTSGKYKINMKKLGYSQEEIDAIVVNPEGPVSKNQIAVYTEQRTRKEFKGVTISGEFDLVFDGAISDYKSSALFKYTKGNSDNDFLLQLSMYRWLNPELITEDIGAINHALLDWTPKARVAADAKRSLPPVPTPQTQFQLMSLEETEEWISNKLSQIAKYFKAEESEIPPCSSEDLWQDPTIYKYYKNPDNQKRSQGNFKSYALAEEKKLASGNVGVIVPVHSPARACNYCNAKPICQQAAALEEAGLLA